MRSRVRSILERHPYSKAVILSNSSLSGDFQKICEVGYFLFGATATKAIMEQRRKLKGEKQSYGFMPIFFIEARFFSISSIRCLAHKEDLPGSGGVF